MNLVLPNQRKLNFAKMSVTTLLHSHDDSVSSDNTAGKCQGTNTVKFTYLYFLPAICLFTRSIKAGHWAVYK